MDNVTIFCEPYTRLKSRGYIFGEDPLQDPTALVLLQVALVNILSAIFQRILKPFGQNSFVPQLLGGTALGPSFFGHNEKFRQKMSSLKGTMVLNVIESVGFLLFLFLLSVRLDLSMFKKCGRLSFVIGVTSFVLPLTITTSMAFIVRNNVQLNEDIHQTLPMVASLESTTSFHVILALLTDLKLLNSELGRVALSSSLISGISSWLYLIIAINVKESSQLGPKYGGLLLKELSRVFLFIVIIFVFRRIIIWMMGQTPEGKSLKEPYICSIILMVFGSSLFGEFTGHHSLMGPVVLGIAIPDRPPVGSSLMDKMGCFVWAVLMPCYIINIGRRVNVFLMGFHTFAIIELLSLVAILGKIIAIMISSLCYKMPFMDALSLSLLLNCQGFFDIQVFNTARQTKLITEEGFGIMVLTTILHSAILAPLVKAFYDPSRRYVAYNRRTVQHIGHNSELRILACIYEQDNVSTITCILEASTPTRESPMVVYALHLKELVGRTMPMVISHQFKKIPSSKRRKVNHIANAFNQFQQQNKGLVMVQCFTAIAPYDTMHDDVCSLALEKDTCLVIIPLSDRPLIRAVNKNVLEKAPCSVGIIFNRGALMECRSILSSKLTFKMCCVFLGGPDDREALVYGARMGEHPSVRLTVLRLVAEDQSIGDLIEKKLDLNVINEFRDSTFCKQHVVYKEESVTEGSDTTRVLSNIVNDFDLILVGRRHDNDSPVLAGLSIWSEIEELGVIGDLLVSPDFDCRASVLVMQQQASVVEKMMESERNTSSQRYPLGRIQLDYIAS